MILGGRERALSVLVQVGFVSPEGWKGQYLCSW